MLTTELLFFFLREIYISHHITCIFAGFLCLLLLYWDLFRYQTVCGHHHIVTCKPEGRTEDTEFSLTVAPSAILWRKMMPKSWGLYQKYQHIEKYCFSWVELNGAHFENIKINSQLERCSTLNEILMLLYEHTVLSFYKIVSLIQQSFDAK